MEEALRWSEPVGLGAFFAGLGVFWWGLRQLSEIRGGRWQRRNTDSPSHAHSK